MLNVPAGRWPYGAFDRSNEGTGVRTSVQLRLENKPKRQPDRLLFLAQVPKPRKSKLKYTWDRTAGEQWWSAALRAIVTTGTPAAPTTLALSSSPAMTRIPARRVMFSGSSIAALPMRCVVGGLGEAVTEMQAASARNETLRRSGGAFRVPGARLELQAGHPAGEEHVVEEVVRPGDEEGPLRTVRGYTSWTG